MILSLKFKVLQSLRNDFLFPDSGFTGFGNATAWEAFYCQEMLRPITGLELGNLG